MQPARTPGTGFGQLGGGSPHPPRVPGLHDFSGPEWHTRSDTTLFHSTQAAVTFRTYFCVSRVMEQILTCDFWPGKMQPLSNLPPLRL